MFCISRIQFTVVWDFKRTSSPLYPQPNGLVEKKNNKKTFRKSKALLSGLLIHWTNPGEPGLSPTEILMGKKLRNNLPVLTKKLQDKCKPQWKEQRAKQKFYFNWCSTSELGLLKPGDPVQIQDPIKKS